jgi:hypothetical protein
MLRQITLRLPIGKVIRNPRSLAAYRPFFIPHREFASKNSPPTDNERTASPISDYIASQKPPTNPDIPADRMPHQTEEDIAMEKIFGDQSSNTNEDGLPAEGVPVEDIFEQDPKAMKKAPEVIKDGGT